jgi:hypothetical protein
MRGGRHALDFRLGRERIGVGNNGVVVVSVDISVGVGIKATAITAVVAPADAVARAGRNVELIHITIVIVIKDVGVHDDFWLAVRAIVISLKCPASQVGHGDHVVILQASALVAFSLVQVHPAEVGQLQAGDLVEVLGAVVDLHLDIPGTVARFDDLVVISIIQP